MARSDEKSHGKKRPAEGDPDGAQPLTKRFGSLQIDNDKGPSGGARTKRDESCHYPRCSALADDAMLLDDTKHTTYIHSLDRELAEPDSPADHLVFLPLAAKMISSVPESLLSTTSRGKELVLYAQPPPSTASDEESTVQRMVAEWRARARARMVNKESHQASDDISPASLGARDALSTASGMGDMDAMDIDFDL
ncbi:uncharacterized protein N7459_006743 [Penicillium hispanicum]|uniref:uncharacterized protein n=1 Tax=Penicillium hispanicum TaxID=1080232 RepID=UPI00253FEAAD|nr:uncharacterized protein N7459_006743 [Penicillium hispanicum]KAJ5577779.1 hypothetical protein N7459_006743 [Penicillium hispanicum]